MIKRKYGHTTKGLVIGKSEEGETNKHIAHRGF